MDKDLDQLVSEFKESWGLYPDGDENPHFNNELEELLSFVAREQILSMPCSVNLHFHPDYSNKAEWRVYPTVRKAIEELQIDLDTFSQYLEWENGAHIIGFNVITESIDINEAK